MKRKIFIASQYAKFNPLIPNNDETSNLRRSVELLDTNDVIAYDQLFVNGIDKTNKDNYQVFLIYDEISVESLKSIFNEDDISNGLLLYHDQTIQGIVDLFQLRALKSSHIQGYLYDDIANIICEGEDVNKKVEEKMKIELNIP